MLNSTLLASSNNIGNHVKMNNNDSDNETIKIVSLPQELLTQLLTN